MSRILEIGTRNYLDDLLSIKKVLSHMETLVGAYNGYEVSEQNQNLDGHFLNYHLNQIYKTVSRKNFLTCWQNMTNILHMKNLQTLFLIILLQRVVM